VEDAEGGRVVVKEIKEFASEFLRVKRQSN